ncbi:site-specific integrase [Kutzneria chonburiensis]|uniref:Tyrosine-type recombinase/integrase n=1 Tax=Kutzneria chonburiensis TaxID=1483604 RepID=A0ABV6MKN2_9PSEU|nr:site-specific integrase [Kutzneria chonburiensis]
MSPRKKNNRKTIPGSVFQRGNKWAYSFYGPEDPLTGEKEKIRKSGFDSDEEAWAAMLEARAELAAETYVKPSKRTVKDFFDAWLPYVKTITEAATAANYAAYAKAYVVPWIGKRPMQDITPSVIAALYDKLLTEGRRKSDSNWAMYQMWRAALAAKREIRPRELAEAVGVHITAARRAVRRYEAGRVPDEPTPGLSPKTVKSVHIMLGPAMATARVWKYISVNPMVGVKPPRVPRGVHNTWTADQVARFLELTSAERLYGLWVLVASTGMRRSELCGLTLAGLDLAAASVRMTTTRVVAGGKVSDSGGKSERSRRQIALDQYTVSVLRTHVAQLEDERRAWGNGYQDHGLVFCWEDGRPIYPDTITEQFNRLVDLAGLPRIRLHDVRHSYATIALRAKVHPKIVSSRLGHATVAFTLDQYSADVPDLDQEAAESIGGLFLPAPPEKSA